MFLKFSFIVILFLTSCNTVEDPSAKYNREFLKSNSPKIRRKKNKHLRIAKENNIYYTNDVSSLVDSDYYEPIRGTKLKKNFRDKKTLDDIPKAEEIKYLDSDISLYYKQRNLKDLQYYDKKNIDGEKILYLADNYDNYLKKGVTFDDIKLDNNKLYGTIEERKDKNYNYIDSAIMQENFDYIDIMNRVKNEIYIKQKGERQKKESPEKGNSTINSVVNKFKDLFNKK